MTVYVRAVQGLAESADNSKANVECGSGISATSPKAQRDTAQKDMALGCGRGIGLAGMWQWLPTGRDGVACGEEGVMTLLTLPGLSASLLFLAFWRGLLGK